MSPETSLTRAAPKSCARIGLLLTFLLQSAALVTAVPAKADETQFTKLLAKAQQGDAEAQYQLGLAYSNGIGIAKDQAVAHGWFLKAGQREHGQAQVSLGSIYSHGFGVKQDWSESIRWFRRAAFQGERVAMHNLGLDYEHAHGVARDFREAAHWYRLGAELGQPRCQYNLGLLSEAGNGLPQSDFEACVLFTLASRHDKQVHIFGEAKAKEVVARRERLRAKLGVDQQAKIEQAVMAFQKRVAVHPRRFGAPGTGVGLTRGWYIWQRFDPQTWEAEVSHDPPGETYKVRVLPWATTYRTLLYGPRPEQLLPGERVNIFFNPDELHARGYTVHFQDELCQMKGHGHSWQIRKLDGKTFSAQAMAGEKALEPTPRDFVLGPSCKIWQAGTPVETGKWSVGDRVYLRWCLRDARRDVMLITDEASLEALKKQEAARLAGEIKRCGIMGRLQSVDGTALHVMIFATHWSQAGTLKQGQAVRLSASGRGYVPQGEPIAAKLVVCQNRGAYGSGVSDVMLELTNAADAQRVRAWQSHEAVHLLYE